MTQRFRFGSAAVLAVLSLSCAKTHLTSTWIDPQTTSLRFQKILVAVMSPDRTVRHSGEDQLVAMIGSGKATASYTLFPDTAAPDKETSLAKIAAAGYDGVVILREVGSDSKVKWVPGTVSYDPVMVSYGPYWSTGWVQTYSPGYLDSKVTIKIEALVYSVKEGKLVWASESETTDPTSARKVVEEIAQGVRSEMRRQGLIP